MKRTLLLGVIIGLASALAIWLFAMLEFIWEALK
jgi:uncharacterized membrane protein YqhA